MKLYNLAFSSSNRIIFIFNSRGRYESFKYVLRNKQNDEYSDSETDNGTTGINQNPTSRSNSFQGTGLYFNNHASSPVLLKVTTS